MTKQMQREVGTAWDWRSRTAERGGRTILHPPE